MTNARGMTVLELMMALAVTVLITMGIAAMVGVVSTGVASKRDTRSIMVRAAVAQARLDSYMAPARSVLFSDPTRIVLWLDDHRQGGTVHLSEVRWISHAGQLIVVERADFSGLGETAAILADLEYVNGSAPNWVTIRQNLDSAGQLRTVELVDGIEGLDVPEGAAGLAAPDNRRVSFTIRFTATAGPVEVPVSSSIVLHQPPG